MAIRYPPVQKGDEGTERDMRANLKNFRRSKRPARQQVVYCFLATGLVWWGEVPARSDLGTPHSDPTAVSAAFTTLPDRKTPSAT
jgi:hypothetical protein